VFENCLTYNGEQSSVWAMVKEVQDEYYKQCEALNVGFYIVDKVEDEESNPVEAN
jgi:hypothetical protein